MRVKVPYWGTAVSALWSMLVWYGGSGTDMAELKSMGQGPWGTERSKQSERRLQDPETQSERCRGAER